LTIAPGCNPYSQYAVDNVIPINYNIHKEGNMAEQIYVRHLDPDGLCRAWASGPVEDRLEILELADKHLALYREEKTKHRDPLATAEYTRTEEIFDGGQVTQ